MRLRSSLTGPALVVGLLAAPLTPSSVVGLLSAWAQAASPVSLRVEWGLRSHPYLKPAIEGYVYNDSTYRVGSVRLRIELLNEANQVIGERLAWVYGNVPGGSRTYFLISPPPRGAHTYRIQVESYDVIAREAP